MVALVSSFALLFIPMVVVDAKSTSPADAFISSLPGADDALFSSLPNMYSGYLDLPSAPEKHMFYYLFRFLVLDQF